MITEIMSCFSAKYCIDVTYLLILQVGKEFVKL